jgi:hypothetical protein
MRIKATVPMSCKFHAPDLLCPILFSHDAPSFPWPTLSFFTTQLLNLVIPWPSQHQPSLFVCCHSNIAAHPGAPAAVAAAADDDDDEDPFEHP